MRGLNQTRPDQTSVKNIMTVKNVTEAKAELSALLVLVEGGEEVVIARAGRPIAKLVQLNPVRPDRKLGQFKGQIWIADDFDAPDPDLEALFYGEVDENSR